MGLSSESSCKFLGDAHPDPVQGHCPQAPHAGAQLPTRAATRARTDLTHGTDGGNRAASLPCPHSSDTGTCNPTPLATGTLEWVEFLCCTPHLFFCSVFKCHIYPGQACCCVCCTGFLCIQINAGSYTALTTSAHQLCSIPALQLPLGAPQRALDLPSLWLLQNQPSVPCTSPWWNYLAPPEPTAAVHHIHPFYIQHLYPGEGAGAGLSGRMATLLPRIRHGNYLSLLCS